ncbi:hypothetical protein ONZ45_g9415 [Pleurotus djamor]|nr:hypothetical protein ONZ45_g9415 [Pleurotus djamor]
MLRGPLILLFSLASIGLAQQAGTIKPEVHPPLIVKQCPSASACLPSQRSIVLDASHRWTHHTSGTSSCYSGNTWNDLCTIDPIQCAQECAVEGAYYDAEHGVTTSGSEVRLNFVTNHQWGRTVGSRVFLLADEVNYEMYRLANRELSFEVDVSEMPCGLKASFSLVDMPRDGGLSMFPHNDAGAQYGTGYCDSQCPRNIKWINGEANSLNWTPYSTLKGKGSYGSCCREVALFHGNAFAHTWAAHPCPSQDAQRCDGEVECGDRPNYTYNRQPNFYGPGLTIDTDHPFSVTTQFITEDGTDHSVVVEIRRYYKQFGFVIPGPSTSITPPPSSGMSSFGPFNSIKDDFCHDSKQVFGETDVWDGAGGLQHTILPQGADRGKVLVMSIENDYDRQLEWLDAGDHGPCPAGSGVPEDVEGIYPNANVQFRDIRFGPLGSTY